jgi:hypothetical protein
MKPKGGVGFGVGLLLVALSACGPGAGPPKGPFAAVWVARESAAVSPRELEELADAGVTELFFESATLDGTGEVPSLVEGFARPLARSFPATLVISGRWTKPSARPSTIAEAWATRFDALALAAQRLGVTPVGVHFELAGSVDEELAATLAALRRRLRGRYHVSVGIDRDALGAEAAAKLARSVDFVTVFAWGQAPGEAEDPARWDLKRTGETLAAARRLRRPIAAGAWTLASARRRSAAGGATEHDESLALTDLLRRPGLEPRAGTVLEALDRQVLEMVARRPVRLGGWNLSPGESVRVVRASTPDLESFLAALPPAGEERIGVLFRSLPAADDALSLRAANLAEALRPGPAEPQLEAVVEELPSTGGRFRFRVVLRNQGSEPTDFASAGANRLELRLSDGVLAAVTPGDFAGWEQLWQGRESRTLRALREADTLYLSAPIVGAGERLASGPIEVRRRGREAPGLRVGGTFLLSSGKILTLPELEWSFGSRP